MNQPAAKNISQSNLLTYAQLLVSGLGFLGTGMITVLLLIGSLALVMSGSSDAQSTTAVFSLMWICALMTLLMFPSVVTSLNRLQILNITLPKINWFRVASILLLIWPLALVIGNMVAKRANHSWILLPPMQILAVGIPIIWILAIAHRQIHNGSQQRNWGIINFSLLITTPLVILAEIVLFIILLLLFVVYLIGQPELVSELQVLAQQLTTIQQPDPEVILPLLQPYLSNPVVIIGILSILAGLIPLLEELFKPMALWALMGRRLTPAQGFVSGALCGGIFSLLESLLSLTQPGEGWLILAVARAGTGMLHITTTALIGWAMASAWQKGTYLKLGITYLISSGIHGFWNGLSVFSALGNFFNGEHGVSILTILAYLAPWALSFLVIGMFVWLWQTNRRLQNSLVHLSVVSIDSSEPV